MTDKSLTEFMKREAKEKCDYYTKTVLMKAEIKTLLMERDISKVQLNDLAEINDCMDGYILGDISAEYGQYGVRTTSSRSPHERN